MFEFRFLFVVPPGEILAPIPLGNLSGIETHTSLSCRQNATEHGSSCDVGAAAHTPPRATISAAVVVRCRLFSDATLCNSPNRLPFAYISNYTCRWLEHLVDVRLDRNGKLARYRQKVMESRVNQRPRGSVTSVRFEALLDKLVAVQWGLEPVCGVSTERAQVVASLGAIAAACHVLRSAIADVRNIICETDGLTTMGRIYTFLASGEAERAEPSDETVSGAPSDARQAIRSASENRPAPVDRRDPQIAEKIKYRQVSLAVQYVAALRAR